MSNPPAISDLHIGRRGAMRWLGGGCAAAVLAGCGGDGGDGGGSKTEAVAATAAIPPSTSLPSPAATSTASAAPLPDTSNLNLLGVVVQAGDSIGVGMDGYAAIDHLAFGDGVAIHNVSVGGRTLFIANQQSAELFGFYEVGKSCVLLIEQGTNDLGQAAWKGEDIYSALVIPFVAAAKACGFYVALNTVLPRSDGGWDAGKEAQRQIYNRLVRENRAGVDAINDCAANRAIGDGVDPSRSAFYVDGLHLSSAGQQQMAAIDAATLIPLLQRPPRPLIG